MKTSTLITNATITNENKSFIADLRISGQRIEQIDSQITAKPKDKVVDAEGMWLLPGMIDDQVHFREPGLTHKGTIATESASAIAGGITSFMEMPNVSPATTTIESLEKKYAIASQNAVANYAFYLGATEDNLEEIKRIDKQIHCGVKVFMGASTGDLLVEKPEALDAIFRDAPCLIVTHCESGPLIKSNLEKFDAKSQFLTIHDHCRIRDAEACYASSSYAVGLAKKYKSQLHVLHITSEMELSLFEPGPVDKKHITAEACVHHLWFTNKDYDRLGNLIKCNPSIKNETDRQALINAVNNDRIDIIATDHAPHTLPEKQVGYAQSPAGLPLVQHALLTLIDHVIDHKICLTKVVEKVSHNPAKRFGIVDRGYIREGYFADLVIIDPKKDTEVTSHNIAYKCGWSPFEGHTFRSRIMATFVNGHLAYDGTKIDRSTEFAHRLIFLKP